MVGWNTTTARIARPKLGCYRDPSVVGNCAYEYDTHWFSIRADGRGEGYSKEAGVGGLGRKDEHIGALFPPPTNPTIEWQRDADFERVEIRWTSPQPVEHVHVRLLYFVYVLPRWNSEVVRVLELHVLCGQLHSGTPR